MAKPTKHIGRMKNTGAKVLVVFRTLPGESDSALILPVNQLSDVYHDALMQLVETEQAQDAFELTSLKLEAKLVSDEREAIARQIDKLSSPEALAKSATDLGMKPSENPTFLSLDKPMLEEEVIEVPVKNG